MSDDGRVDRAAERARGGSERTALERRLVVAAFAAVLLVLAGAAWAGDARLSWIFTLCYGALALVPFAVEPGRTTRLDPFEPYLGLSVLVYLYGVSTILLVEETGATYFSEYVPPQALERYAVACLLGLLGLVLGSVLFRWGRGTRASTSAREDSGDEALRVLSRGMLVLALVLLPFYADRFNFLEVVGYAESAFAVRLERMADTSAGIKDVLLKDSPAAVLLCIATAVLFDRSAAAWRRGLGAAALAAYMATSLLSGWRGQLVAAALIPVVYFHYRVRRLRPREVLFVGALAYTLVNALAVMRAAARFSDMWSLLENATSEQGLTFLALSQSGELATSSNLLRLIIGIEDGETDFRSGGLLVSQIGSVVPRALWPDRPPVGNELFTQMFYPGVFESGGGLGFFILQDGYWDFGLAGVVVYSALLSALCVWVYEEIVVRRQGAFWPLLYALVYGQLVVFSVRTGLLLSIKSGIMVALPLLAALQLGRWAVKLRRRTGDA